MTLGGGRPGRPEAVPRSATHPLRWRFFRLGADRLPVRPSRGLGASRSNRRLPTVRRPGMVSHCCSSLNPIGRMSPPHPRALQRKLLAHPGHELGPRNPRRVVRAGRLIRVTAASVAKAGSGKTGREFAAELAATNPRSLLEVIRRHKKIASCEETLRQITLPGCKEGTDLWELERRRREPCSCRCPMATSSMATAASSMARRCGTASAGTTTAHTPAPG